MPRQNKRPVFPVTRSVYLTRETDEILMTISGLLNVGWATLVRAVLDEYVNRTQEAGVNAVLHALNTDLTKEEKK